MRIEWDEAKNKKLFLERSIQFEEVAELILNKKILEIVKNPTRPNQYYFVLNLKNYTHLVPFVISNEETIFLKTAFPSRKFHKKYGSKIEKEN